MSTSFKDVAQLVNGLEYPNSVQWADDGTLAVAEGSCIGILHPGSLNGAQAFAAVDGFAQDTVIAAPGKPNGSCIHFDVALSLRVLLSPVKESAAGGGGKGGKPPRESSTNQSRRPLASAKAISWSPSGASTAGGCLIATVTNDHRVIIFGPDKKLDPEWHPLFVVHEKLLNYLTETQWADIDAATLRESGALLGAHQGSGTGRGNKGRIQADSEEDEIEDEDATEDEKDEDDDEEEAEMLRLRGGASGESIDEGEDSLTEDEEIDNDANPSEEEEEEEEEKPVKKTRTKPPAAAAAAGKKTGRGRGTPRGRASTQKQSTAGPIASAPAPGGSNRRKAAAPQLAPAGDATDLGTDLASPSSAGADAALAAQAVLAGIPPVEFQSDRLPKLVIADTAAKRFFELRRQQEPSSLPTYEKTSTHLKGVDKANLEQVSEEYYNVYKDKITTELRMDKKTFFKECRIALPRCWNRRRNIFIEDFEKSIGGGFGPGGIPQEESSGEEGSDAEATEDEDRAAEGGRMLRTRRAVKPAIVEADNKRKEEDKEEAEEGAAAGAEQPKSKRKRGGATAAATAPEPVFERDVFEIPSEGFTWRDLPPVDNSNRTTVKMTLLDGAIKRFLRLRAAEPTDLLPTYLSQKNYLKGVDAWIVDRVIKEYMHGHAPAMAALQFDTKKFTVLFNARLRQVWERSTGALLESEFDINSDGGLEHPVGSGEIGTLGPVPIRDKYDPYLQKRTKATAAAATGGGTGASRTRGGGGAGSSGASAGGSKTAKKRNGRPKVGFGYQKDSLGGTQWWGGSDLNGDVYERRLLSISSISVAWSPAVVGGMSSSTSSGITNGTGNSDGHGSNKEIYSILAVGSKEGSIWLWKCRHPAVHALPGSKEEESAGLEERMSFLGRLPGNLSWADTMKWVSIPIHSVAGAAGGGSGSGGSVAAGGSGAVDSVAGSSMLVLVVGTSDGAVTLWGTDSSSLASYTAPSSSSSPSPSSSSSPMIKLITIVQPDLTQVISLDAALRYNNDNDHGHLPSTSNTVASTGAAAAAAAVQLVVAIGKSAGGVAAWTSLDLPLTTTVQPKKTSSKDQNTTLALDKIKLTLQKPGQLLKIPEPSGLGSSSVTGVGLTAGAEMVVACSREGALESWSLPPYSSSNINNITANGSGSNSGSLGVLLLQPRSAPLACTVRKQKESGFGSYGVAVSPGGMFVAVPKNALPAGTEYVKQLQVWQRLALGLLHINRIAGPGAEIDGFSAATRICKSWAAQQLSPAAIWDVVMLCKAQEGLALAVAEILETEFLQIQHSVTTAPEKLVPSNIPEYAWNLLKAAVTLRRSAAAAAVAAAKMDHAAAALEIPHQEILDRDQMLLLQKQLEKLLRTTNTAPAEGTTADDQHEQQQQQRRQLRRLLAADCVVANAKHPDLFLGLLPLAVKAYHEAGETPPGEANAFAIPSRDGGRLLDHRPVAMAGGSAVAALTTMFHEEGQAVVLHRCPATLEVSLGSGKWVCRGCQRAYNELPGSNGNENEEGGDGGDGGERKRAPPGCVMCGGLLGPYCPDFLLISPCI